MPERNQTLWRGIRPTDPEEIFTRLEPPEDCTYVDAYGHDNNEMVIVYTVPANRRLFLTTIIFSARTTANDVCELWLYNSTPAIYRHIAGIRVLPNEAFSISITPALAIQMPTGHSIRCRSYNAGCAVTCYINGYLRTV